MCVQKFVVALMALTAFSCVTGMGITVPGTNWCGPGNIAKNYDDLGAKVEIDMCCRAHDNCAEKISPLEQLNDLRNTGLFPIFSCDCEAKFRRCLNQLHNVESAGLGRIYFSTTKVCFAQGAPIVTCREHQFDMFGTRCISYEEDVSQRPRWQFYDLALYTHLSAEELQQQAGNNLLN